MISWIGVIIGVLGAWHYTDLHSDSALQNIVCPILFAVFLIVLLIKLVLLLGPENGRGGGGFGGSSGFSGGDGGCGGDGCQRQLKIDPLLAIIAKVKLTHPV